MTKLTSSAKVNFILDILFFCLFLYIIQNYSTVVGVNKSNLNQTTLLKAIPSSSKATPSKATLSKAIPSSSKGTPSKTTPLSLNVSLYIYIIFLYYNTSYIL